MCGVEEQDPPWDELEVQSQSLVPEVEVEVGDLEAEVALQLCLEEHVPVASIERKESGGEEVHWRGGDLGTACAAVHRGHHGDGWIVGEAGESRQASGAAECVLELGGQHLVVENPFGNETQVEVCIAYCVVTPHV